MTTGSTPVFPIIKYSCSLSYVLNFLNIAKAKKEFFTYIPCTKNTLIYLKFFKSTGFIFKYELIDKKNRIYIKAFLNYTNGNQPVGNFKLIFKPSHSIYISIKALKLFQKRAGNSALIISTPYGFLSHRAAILKKKGGLVVGLLTI